MTQVANGELSRLVRQWVATSEDLVTQGPPPDADEGTPEPAPFGPALPRRRRDRPESPPGCRLAVLIDAQTTPADSADALFDVLALRGTVRVSRAYGDWTSPDSQTWMTRMRHHGIQPFHHFAPERDQRSMVAMSIDAMDLAREAAVDVVVIVGDLSSAHPLVQRLHAGGIPVLAFGPTDTPDDVRATCEEFTDVSLLDACRAGTVGRHRA